MPQVDVFAKQCAQCYTLFNGTAAERVCEDCREPQEYDWAFKPPVRTEPAPLSPEEIKRIVNNINF